MGGWMVVAMVVEVWYGRLDNWMTEWMMDKWMIGKREN